MSMDAPSFRVGVVVERRPSKSLWVDHAWRIVAILPTELANTHFRTSKPEEVNSAWPEKAGPPRSTG